MSQTLSRQREITLRFLAEPTDVNILGKVHGGQVMKWIDHAGYGCAAGWSGKSCVTVYVGGIRFYKPVHIGDMVEVHAKLLHTGRTSMHISVEVAAGDPRDGQYTKTTQCMIVFVAINAAGNPIPVPPWTPQTPEDIALDRYAQRLSELSKEVEEEVKRQVPNVRI